MNDENMNLPESNEEDTDALNNGTFVNEAEALQSNSQLTEEQDFSVLTPPYTGSDFPNPRTFSQSGVPFENEEPTQSVPQSFTPPPYSSPQGFEAPEQSSAKPRKKSVGARVMLICLWVLLGAFATTTIGTVGYYIGAKSTSQGSYSHKNPITDYLPTRPQEETQPESTPSADIKEDNSYLFGTGTITLNAYPEDKSDSAKYNTQSAFNKISPSTVGVVCYSDESRTSAAGQGTGIIVSSDGYIATNSHVIGDSLSAYEVTVILNDGNIYEAKVVGFDSRTDLAIIKITAQGLEAAEFADSDLISIGEDVIAVGNPGGIEFQNTLTRGIVSAKDRTLGLSTQVKYIQTDAAINPGNSGGPLCNIYGQVIGINSAKIASEDYEGMGFAIPSRTVKEVVDDLISQGYVSGRVKIGIVGSAVTQAQAQYNNIPLGIYISQITENGPCDNRTIQVGDIIVALDGHSITSFNEIYTLLTDYSQGDKATLKLYRPSDNQYYETEIILQADTGSANVQ